MEALSAHIREISTPPLLINLISTTSITPTPSVPTIEVCLLAESPRSTASQLVWESNHCGIFGHPISRSCDRRKMRSCRERKSFKCRTSDPKAQWDQKSLQRDTRLSLRHGLKNPFDYCNHKGTLCARGLLVADCKTRIP